MKLPFQHSEEEVTIPINEVKKLREEGKSDREIIMQLKGRGYSFQAIEKAMLQALKEGVGPKKTPSSPMPGGGAPPSPQPTLFKEEASMTLPTRGELEPKQKISVPPSPIGPVPLEAQFEPTALIEEVVEGVVEEKFEKLDKKFEYIHAEQEKMKKENENLKRLIGAFVEKEKRHIENLRKENEILTEKIEDLVVKTNALERAFKQFLPDIFSKVREMKLEEKGIKVIEEKPTEEKEE
jgi:NurA-like 5'-3' nuclease